VKDFDLWNEQKKILDITEREILFKEGEVWWCAVGMNVGTESYGKGGYFSRPVLILKKLSHNSFIGIPISTKKKTGTWFAEINFFGQQRWALLYQIKMFSSNRLQRRILFLEVDDLTKIKEKLGKLLKLS
jgi:mRNA interferase MazF